MAARLVRVFYRHFFWFVPLWYGLSMTLTRRKRKYPAIELYRRVEDIPVALHHGDRWREDPVRGLLDVAMHPRKFQSRIDADAPEFGDCDDHAVYWATTLLASGLCVRAWLASVSYEGKDGKVGGHAVCVFERTADRFFWADYNDPRPTAGFDWATQIVNARNATLLGAGMVEVELHNGGPRFLWRSRKTWAP